VVKLKLGHINGSKRMQKCVKLCKSVQKCTKVNKRKVSTTLYLNVKVGKVVKVYKSKPKSAKVNQRL